MKLFALKEVFGNDKMFALRKVFVQYQGDNKIAYWLSRLYKDIEKINKDTTREIQGLVKDKTGEEVNVIIEKHLGGEVEIKNYINLFPLKMENLNIKLIPAEIEALRFLLDVSEFEAEMDQGGKHGN